MHKVNCLYNDEGAYCTNLKVKRSLFGMGARCCIEYGTLNANTCEHKVEFPKPISPPPSPAQPNLPITKRAESILNAINNKSGQLEAHIADLESALRFYADSNNYNRKPHYRSIKEGPSFIELDRGNRATEILEKGNEKSKV